MTNRGAALLVQAMACQARIAAMQATNLMQYQNSQTVAYEERHFYSEAQSLSIIADSLYQEDERLSGLAKLPEGL